MRNFREYDVWRRAHQITLRIYSITREFPSEERFGLTSQMRRASSSIGLNIAEGAGKVTDSEFALGITHAMGSLCELEYALLLSRDLSYVREHEHAEIDAEVQTLKRMLYRLHRTLKGR